MSYLLCRDDLVLVNVTNIVFLKYTAVQLLFSEVEDVLLLTLHLTSLTAMLPTRSFFTILDSSTMLNLDLLR